MTVPLSEACSFVPPLVPQLGVNFSTNVPASTAPSFVLGSTYGLGFVVIDPVSRIEYESLKAANTGHAPSISPEWWLPLGVENRLRMINGSVASQTTNPEQIVVHLTPGRVITTLAILNANAQSVRIVMDDPDEGPVYDETVSLVLPAGSWSRWYRMPILRDTRMLVMDLPAYSQATLTVTITNAGGIAACGELVVGRAIVLGSTAMGASASMDDYSVKVRDKWGGWTIKEGGFSDTARFQVFVDDEMVDRIRDTLTPYRARACLYIGAPDFRSLWTWGFFESFDEIFSDYGVSDCNLSTQGIV